MGKNLAKDMSREELDQMRALFSDAPSIVAIIDMALRGLDAADERDRYADALSQIATGWIKGLPMHCPETSYMRAEIASEAVGMDKPVPPDTEPPERKKDTVWGWIMDLANRYDTYVGDPLIRELRGIGLAARRMEESHPPEGSGVSSRQTGSALANLSTLKGEALRGVTTESGRSKVLKCEKNVRLHLAASGVPDEVRRLPEKYRYLAHCARTDTEPAELHGQALRESNAQRWESIANEIERALAAAPEAGHQHPDDAAVDRFAKSMKEKLAKAREKGRGGWDDPEQCPAESLANMLIEHLRKDNPGNYLDIANFAMMLHERGVSASVLSHLVNAESDPPEAGREPPRERNRPRGG